MSTPLRRTSLENCRLYVIIDRAALKGRDPVRVAEAAIQGGADLLQWRDKSSPDREFLKVARALRHLTRKLRTLFLVNDRVAIAMLVHADGVHLGHQDFSVREVRSLVGRKLLIGRSTHSIQEAIEQEMEGADYLGVGPVFSTPTKPDYRSVGIELLEKISQRIRIPWFAIGGIDLKTLPLVLSAGAFRVAVVRAVGGMLDPKDAARSMKRLLMVKKLRGSR